MLLRVWHFPHSARNTNCDFCGLKEKNILHLSLSLSLYVVGFLFLAEKGTSGRGTESIEWWLEDQAFLRSYDPAPRPPPSTPLPRASCLSFSVFLCVAGQTYWREWGVMGWSRSQIVRPRGSLVLFKSFNTLWQRECGIRGAPGRGYLLENREDR